MSASRDRWVHVLLVGVIAFAFVGFAAGLRQGVPDGRSERRGPRPAPADSALPAVTYDELGLRGPGAYRGPRYTVADLGVPRLDLSREVEVDLEAKTASLAERAGRRAFNGAPPTIPHAAEGLTDAGCVACHAVGIEVAGKRASLVPHAHYRNCRQCHVAGTDFPGAEVQPPANTFAGLPAPEGGDRAWKGAPPLIPHSTWMRENCLACHGPLGKPGMRTSHPGRVNCVQCHGRSASLDPFEPVVAALLYDPPEELTRAVGPPRRGAPGDSLGEGGH